MSASDWRLGSARVSRTGDGVLAVANFLESWSGRAARGEGKFVAARRRNQHARRVPSPERIL
jgi:hypothetical protein